MSAGVTSSKILKVCKALNCETKLRIIDTFFREGEKSITDVKNQLNISFSTVHKYLKQLEKAGILVSFDRFIDNRLKKMYYLNTFAFHLTPEVISASIKRKTTYHTLRREV